MITPFLAAGPMNREPAQCRPPPTEEGRGGLPRTPTWPPVCLSVRGERGPQAAPAAADMTVPAGPAVLVALLLTRDLVAGSIATAPVRPGGNVTLRCDIPLQYETLWFVQRPNATPAMGVAVSKSLRGGLVHRGPDPRLTGELDATAGSVRLRIRDVGEADLAMYYCADRVGGRLVVGNGTRLVFPGKRQGRAVSTQRASPPDTEALHPAPGRPSCGQQGEGYRPPPPVQSSPVSCLRGLKFTFSRHNHTNARVTTLPQTSARETRLGRPERVRVSRGLGGRERETGLKTETGQFWGGLLRLRVMAEGVRRPSRHRPRRGPQSPDLPGVSRRLSCSDRPITDRFARLGQEEGVRVGSGITPPPSPTRAQCVD
ncbi:uncharacterized protein [Lepisosteus oculatus]|uniref:uncharacterized protein isoform X1 n=1 Tax=Lepisosteus oculatus TaxID=7918 RepID=UPI0035F52073